MSEVLRKADVTIKSITNCSRNWAIPMTAAQICAGNGATEGGICLGDSGGGLVCNRDGKRYLIGIASWVAIDIKGRCAVASMPNIYSRICHVIPWIKETIASFH